MTDRELLELAARAAGLALDTSGKNGGAKGRGFDVMGDAILDWHNGTRWNPLRKDDDALRLAVSLNLSVSIECESANTVTVQWGFDQSGEAEGAIEQSADIGDYAATRRAIVRAAAEIGRNMDAPSA